ncbi:YhcH/YjgK/YiaL family protein [bacterium]|nr:YhcH/YjgK/YiaL family protein [bacterium]
MIIDKLENAHLYYCLNRNIEKGLKFLQSNDMLAMEDGKHIIDGDKIYANVQSGMTKEPSTTPWEAHKIYTDIQYIIKGAEIMGWANLENFKADSEYDEEKDVIFGNAKGSYVTVPENYFVIFTPEDAHKPMLKIIEEKPVKKVIVKVK